MFIWKNLARKGLIKLYAIVSTYVTCIYCNPLGIFLAPNNYNPKLDIYMSIWITICCKVRYIFWLNLLGIIWKISYWYDSFLS